MKTSVLIKAIFCSLFVLALASGQNRERFHAGSQDGMMLHQLNLSDTQKKDVEKLNSDFAKQRVEQQAKIRIAAIDLHSLMKAESPDKGAIEKKIGEINDLQAQNRVLGVDHWFSVNKLLNADQQKIWKHVLERPLRERFAARMRQMRNRTPGPSREQPMLPESHE